MSEEIAEGAKDVPNIELFLQLQGIASENQYDKWKDMQSQTSHMVEAPTGSAAEESSQSKLKDWLDMLSTSKSELTLQYITGKISFEEFSTEIEKQQQDAEEEELDEDELSVIDVTYDPTKVVVKTEPEGEGEEEEEDMEYVDDDRDKDWEPSDADKEGKARISKPKEKQAKTGKRSPVKKKRIRSRRLLKNDVPKHLQGLMGEANLRFARGEKEEAVKMCMEIIRIAPNSYLPFQTLGMIHEELEQTDKAIQFFLIAAHLRPDDSDEWIRLAELSMEQNNTKQAVLCLNKAVKYSPNNMEFLWQRSNLYDSIGENKKALEGYQMILKLIPDNDGESYLQLARNVTKRFHELGENQTSIDTIKYAVQIHPNIITSEDVNLLLELSLTEKQYRLCIEVLVEHCGVKVYLANNVVWQASSDSKPELGIKSTIPIRVFAPDLLPVDLRVKLVVCLIHLGFTKLSKEVLQPMYMERTVDETGDLYFDVADAFMEMWNYAEARPILRTLVASSTFNKAAVWLRYGECLNSLGDLHAAVDAYAQCVERAPGHFGARVSLSALQQQLGKHEEALKVLSRDDQDDLSSEDQLLLLHKCHLLHSQGKVDEFHTASQKLLFSSFLSKCNANFMKIVFSYRSHKHRADALRTFISYQDPKGKGEIADTMTSTKSESSSSAVKVDDLWDIYLQLYESMILHKKFDNLLEITTLALACPQFMNDTIKVKESDFMCLTACMLQKNGQFAYNFVKEECLKNMGNNQAWNLFCQVMTFAMDIRHNRFALRLCIKHPDVLALGIINGHNSLISGTYKHSLGEYMAVFRQTPRDALVSLCIGLCFIHMACQKFNTRKHSLVTQGLAFLNNYVELRGECQETVYNLGRAMHQLDLKYAAVYYYKKALSLAPIIDDENKLFDLSREIAHNLAIIYNRSGSRDMARLIIEQYCVI